MITIEKEKLQLARNSGGKNIAICIGGFGEKKSNNGSQYFQQNRIYYGGIALCLPANLPSGSYYYVIKDEFKK